MTLKTFSRRPKPASTIAETLPCDGNLESSKAAPPNFETTFVKPTCPSWVRSGLSRRRSSIIVKPGTALLLEDVENPSKENKKKAFQSRRVAAAVQSLLSHYSEIDEVDLIIESPSATPLFKKPPRPFSINSSISGVFPLRDNLPFSPPRPVETTSHSSCIISPCPPRLPPPRLPPPPSPPPP
eukprot:CAMPEP_0175046340 /NCGR_PEP_ID=MMETSP0052_2-20121109/4978_1 /TAXON_ID=51329 ORGANISM="Polytomella parva, Strain SAG 63-3" /NCGR_SAMPLE_ID=MMETSP0052_2 /ASSEMBLY_ACC=CAM_ASM_000194 /LENGTH=182 /DNA_ID=CAMNT_0016310079 /DNA_START=177 /DNA_END=722 /DNA_ORIENTATION=-